MLRASLEQQFLDGRLTFVGSLSDQHTARMNEIITNSQFIRPNLKPFLLTQG